MTLPSQGNGMVLAGAVAPSTSWMSAVGSRRPYLELTTLLLLGGESPPFLRAAIERLHGLLPNSRIHEMPGQQHLAMDAVPDEFVRVVSEFLS